MIADGEARSHIENDLNVDLFVEAGAGTGKTTELVARIVELIRSGRATIEQIVAITFTEAAAAELRERIREALEREDDLYTRLARERIDEAPIHTIHGFAQRLLQTHPTEAGLPPVFRVVDGVQARAEEARQWRRFVRSTFASTVPLSPAVDELLRTAIALGFQLRHGRGLAQQLHEMWHRLDPPEQPTFHLGPLPIDQLVSHTHQALALIEHCTGEEDTLHRRLVDHVAPWIDRVRRAHDNQDQWRLLTELQGAPSLVSTRIGNRKWWPKECLEAARNSLAAAGTTRQQLLAGPQQAVLAGMLGLIGRFVVDAASARHSAGDVSFHDLLVLTRRLLAEHSDVRTAVREQYHYILIDEYQDTDPLQAELVGLLTDRSDGPGGARFTVGDPKQSIYRFRGADLDQYLRTRNDGRAEVVHLTSNFRTLPNIVTWVNEVFPELLSSDAELAFVPLQAARALVGHNAGSVRALGGPVEGVDTATLRSHEAADVSTTIERMHGERWEVIDGSEPRPLRYHDVAVLLPTRTGLPALERALQASAIPYRIESRSLLWSTQELRDVLALLRAIDDPGDAIGVVAALRSPALACGDDDLVTWHHHGGAWDYSAPTTLPADDYVVGRAFERLRLLHEQRWWHSVAGLVERVINELRLRELAFAQPRHRETWARLRFIVDRVDQWEHEGGGSLGDFVEWARRQATEGADALESVVAEADDDAVRIMTVHAAKGLEFPAVIVAGLNSTPAPPPSARVLWSPNNKPLLRIGRKDQGWESNGFAEAEERERNELTAEEARLLYVAVTRARDHLIVSLHHRGDTSDGRRCLAARLMNASSEVPWPDALVISSSEHEHMSVPSLPIIDESSWERDHRRLLAAATRAAAYSATTVARRNGGRELPDLSVVEETPSDRRTLAERLAFGRAVHHVLETSTWADAVSVSTTIDRAARYEHCEDRRDDLVRSVAFTLDARPLKEAQQYQRCWREVFVATEVGDTVVEGYVDLVYERPDGLVVVDYKTDALADAGAVDELVGHYQWQLVTYAVALQHATGQAVAEVALVVVPPDASAATVITLDDLPNRVAAYPDLIANM